MYARMSSTPTNDTEFMARQSHRLAARRVEELEAAVRIPQYDLPFDLTKDETNVTISKGKEKKQKKR